MAGFGQNDEVVSSKSKPFGVNDEVVSGGNSDVGSLKQPSTPSPTFMDRISTEMNGGGAMLEPDKIVAGLGNSLSRSAQAYSRLRGGGSPQFSDVVDSVPLVGPMAHGAYTKLKTPGQRIEGLTDFGMMAVPELAERGPAIAESMERPISVTSGALRGGGRAAIIPIDFKGIPVPASLAGGGMGSLAGYPFGTTGRVVGAGVGATLPFVRGAVEGGRRAGELFDLNRAPTPGPRPAFQGHDFTPPIFGNEPPTGKPGAVLPSGSIVGPAAPSVTNPPLPRGLPPRTPLWDRAGVAGTPNAGTPDAAPIYSATPILDSGHVIGPRPTIAAEPNGGTVVSAPQSGVPQTTSKPFISQLDLDTLNQQLRDSLKARGVPVADTPATIRERVNANRAKFGPDGVNNQVRKK